jgi:hypothetical protein
VLGTTLIHFPDSSAEVFGNLAMPLGPGWYALVFGSGLFNASGSGASLRNNTDIGMPAYIGFQNGFGWGERASQEGKRFVIEGNVVPEPTAIAILIVPATFPFGRNLKRYSARNHDRRFGERLDVDGQRSKWLVDFPHLAVTGNRRRHV